MNKREYIISLFEIYKDLLTDKQKEYFEYYYLEDLSLSEITENVNVSRAIINKTIKVVEKKLLNYEKSLKVYESKNKIRQIIDKSTKEIKEELEELL